MTKKIMILMLLSLFLATNAIASLTYVAGTSEGVIYDDLNDTYWFSDLSVFTLWNFDQQITVIDTLPQTFTYPFIWHMATEQDILGLTQSYSPEIITSYFKASYGSTWEGWTQTESPYYNNCHVIYQITDYTAMGGDFYGTFIYNYSDSSHNSYLGAWVVGEPAWIPVANAGPDQIVFNEITLDGLQSTDSDGIIGLYEWQILHRENPAYDRTAVGDKPTISDLEPGFYDVTLTVTDNDGAVNADTMVFSAMGRKGDLNMDGDVDGDDLSEFSEEYGN